MSEKKSTITPEIIMTDGLIDIAFAVFNPINAPECWPKLNEWKFIGDKINNLEREIPQELENELKSNKVYCGYPAWNFYAYVWFNEDKFHAHINQYREHVDTLDSNSIKELMEICSDKYGYD